MRTKIGRNDPCPCGSGLKYKRCCGGTEDPPQPAAAEGNLPANVQAALDALSARQYANIEDAQAAVATATARTNSGALDDFVGLSPAEMHRLLHFPFNSPDSVRWADPLPVAPNGEAIELAVQLLEALGSAGAKRTATGNLPRNLCRELLAQFQAVHGEDRFFGPQNLQQELDFGKLHRVRVTMELAGLIRKYRGRFLPTRMAQERLANHGAAGIYPALIQAYAQPFNWAYDDRLPAAPMLQHCFLFSLYLLDRLGSEWRPTTVYEDAVIRAFPLLLDEFEDTTYWSREVAFRRTYTLRMLHRFAAFFGLIQITAVERGAIGLPPQLQSLPLLGQVVRFQLGRR
jgi:hypothetical protein